MIIRYSFFPKERPKRNKIHFRKSQMRISGKALLCPQVVQVRICKSELRWKTQRSLLPFLSIVFRPKINLVAFNYLQISPEYYSCYLNSSDEAHVEIKHTTPISSAMRRRAFKGPEHGPCDDQSGSPPKNTFNFTPSTQLFLHNANTHKILLSPPPRTCAKHETI
jgi:hypothetical protein